MEFVFALFFHFQHKNISDGNDVELLRLGTFESYEECVEAAKLHTTLPYGKIQYLLSINSFSVVKGENLYYRCMAVFE